MADTSAPLSKVDSVIEHGDAVDKKPSHRRASSSAAGVRNIADLGMSDDTASHTLWSMRDRLGLFADMEQRRKAWRSRSRQRHNI
jgi:hypothetical protein